MTIPTDQALLALGLEANTLAFLLELPLTAYSDSSTCRFEVRYLPESVAVVVVNQAPSAAITPVNLAAALSQDCPKRDVYLWEDQASGSLVSRIRAAGIRGVIDLQQLQQLLAMSNSEPVFADANPVAVETKISNNPWRIDDTELEACDLDEPRDQPYTSTPAYQTGLDSRMDMMPNNPKAVPGGPFTSPSSPPNVQPPGAQPFSPTVSELQSFSVSSEAKLFDNAVASSIPTGYPITADQMTSSPTVSSQQPYPLVATALQPYPGATTLQSDQTPGSIIGVFSGRGGVGKSTVALLLALIAYQRGLRTALIDADLQFGDIAYLLGDKLHESVDSRPLLAFQQQAAATINNQKLLVLTAPDNVEQSELLSEAIPTIVQEVALSFDIVLINTSAFWTATQAQLARICTRLLLLMDQRATSIKACQRVLELCIKLQIPEARFSFAINGCHRFAPISTQDASLALGGQQIIGLDDGGALVDELLSIGCPGELVESSNVFIHSLEKLLDHLMPMAWRGLDATHNSYHESTKPAGFNLLKNLFKRGTRDVA